MTARIVVGTLLKLSVNKLASFESPIGTIFVAIFYLVNTSSVFFSYFFNAMLYNGSSLIYDELQGLRAL